METDSLPTMEKLTQEKGLILWIPKNPNKEKIKKALQSELEFIELSLVITNKDDIIPLLKNAIMHFGAYPNRILRFNIVVGCAFPNKSFKPTVCMSWENPSKPIKTFMYRYNP